MRALVMRVLNSAIEGGLIAAKVAAGFFCGVLFDSFNPSSGSMIPIKDPAAIPGPREERLIVVSLYFLHGTARYREDRG